MHAERTTELASQGDIAELRRHITQIPLDKACAEIRSTMRDLSPQQRREIWRQVGARNDRLAGIFCVADLRMPPQPVFGPAKLSVGNKETDYDRARTFILETRSAERITTPVRGMFYPELAAFDKGIRALKLAASHINCTPKSNRQLNLFSMRGAFNRQQANLATHKRTTCALFTRSVLVSAGDGRFTADMLASAAKQLQGSTSMIMAMGLHLAGYEITSSEWISAIPKKQGKPESGRPEIPAVGDVYMVAIPSSGWVPSPTTKADSGHVGFVASVERQGENTIVLSTYDGGQGTDGLRSTFTQRRVLTRDAKGHWQQTSHPQVNGETRILVGWVDMSSIASKFQSAGGILMDGRSYATKL